MEHEYSNVKKVRDTWDGSERPIKIQSSAKHWQYFGSLKFEKIFGGNYNFVKFRESMTALFFPVQLWLEQCIQSWELYCLTIAERDEKVEGSCLRTIFNSDFFLN